MSDYNYANFPRDLDAKVFEDFPIAIRLCDPPPDGDLIDASNGETVRLSSYWARGPVVIEFGSLT